VDSKTKLTLREMIALSRSIEIDNFEVSAPNNLAYKPFQKVAIKWISLFDKVLIADPPGAGKTIEIAGFINLENPGRILIYVPASLLLNWKKELQKWMISPLPIYTWKEFDSMDRKPAKFIVLSSFYYAGKKEAILKVLKLKELDLLVIDETHAFKNMQAQRTKLLFAVNGPFKISKKIVAMTGTPIVNRPIETYPIIKRLAPHLIQNMTKFEFGMKYCAGWATPWGIYDFTGASSLKELGTNLRSGFMIRREKSAIMPQLPKLMKNLVYLDKKAPKHLSFKDDNVSNKGAVAFEEGSTAHLELGLLKLPLAIEYLKTMNEGGHTKMIVFAHHREVLKGLFEGLKELNPVILMGGMTPKAKDEAVTKFQEDPTCEVFIGSIIAAGVGLTLTAASYVALVEADWRPGINDQAIDRAHRMGQESTVLAEFLVIEGTLDERKLKLNLEKTQNAKEFFE
jgi:SWI/SNF-related matrix-associated actin-dependent regulator 1 of chromatin subfamily A